MAILRNDELYARAARHLQDLPQHVRDRKTAQLLQELLNEYACVTMWKPIDYVPPDEGWYTVCIEYDVREGPFLGVAHWNGSEWNKRAVVAFGERYESEELALAATRGIPHLV